MSSLRTPRRRFLGWGTAALLLVASYGGLVHAAPIPYEFAGVITSADPSTGVAPGSQFSGTFAYDPSENPGSLSIEGSNQYMYGSKSIFPNPVSDGSGLTLQVGRQTVLSNPGGVQVSIAEIEYPGQYGYSDQNGPASPYTKVGISNENTSSTPIVALNLTNPNRSVFGSLAPPAFLNLADFPQAQLEVTELTNPGSTTLYTGTIDSLTVVPEPPTATLFCLAAAAWLARWRRR